MMINVLVPFTSGVEEIELVTIVDILRRADIKVTMSSLDGKPVVGRSGITIHADVSLAKAKGSQWDMMVLPGGLPNAELLQNNPLIKELAMSLAQDNKYLAAICAAPAAFASFGLFNGKVVTSHPCVEEQIKQQPSACYCEDAVVEDGMIITSRGAGTAVAFALHLVARLTSQITADAIKEAIQA